MLNEMKLDKLDETFKYELIHNANNTRLHDKGS